MDRNDFIETREDIVQNIKTLYSYLEVRWTASIKTGLSKGCPVGVTMS